MPKLTELSTERGAPMGRATIHRTGLTAPRFDLERVPLIDGGYDCGGAYWGTPDNLWWADFTTPLTKTVIVSFFVRAASRDEAMKLVRETYKDAEFTTETGDIIEQTIAFLQNYLDQADAMGDEEHSESTQEEIDYLLEKLADIRGTR